MQTDKLKDMVKSNVTTIIQEKTKQASDFWQRSYAKKAINKTVHAVKNADAITKVKNTLDPANIKAAATKTYEDMVKAPIAKAQAALKEKKEQFLDMPLPNFGLVPETLGPATYMTVREGIEAAKNTMMQIVGNKDGSGERVENNTVENTVNVDYSNIRAYRDIEIEKIPIEYRADPRLVSEMNYKGKKKSGTNAAGWERSASKHFDELLDKHPEFFSEANVERIENGLVPIVDEDFIKYFPQYNDCMGDKLIHHHIGGGGQAAAVPQSLHKGFGGIHNFEKEHNIRGNDPLSEIGEVFTSEKKP